MWPIPPSRLFLLPPFLRSLGFHSSFACQDQSRCVADPNNMRFSQIPLGGLVTSTATAFAATNLFVASYTGTITTLLLRHDASGGYSLKTTSVNTEAQTNPSWLTQDKLKGIIYSTDEGFSGPNGSVSAYSASESGHLTLLGRTVTVGGPVNSVVYNGGKGLAVAHYGGSAVTSWTIQADGTLAPLQALTFQLTAPGANPARQDAPHLHEVLTDPTGSFIVAPDLGADLIRVFSIDPTSSLLTETPSFTTPPGSGPRHGAFLKAACGKTYFFLIWELSNMMASYEVTYGEKSLRFEEVFTGSVYGPTAPPAGAGASEVEISPDHRFLLASSRNATLFQIPNFDSGNRTQIPSDTLHTWSIDDATGKLSFVQLAPAGGSYPRHFSLNKAGTLAAVGLQKDGRVVIVQRDVESGMLGDIVASVDVAGEITSVIWDE